MNIFFLDEDPRIAASYLCDKHLPKMALESCQMLALAFSLEQLAHPDCPRTKKGTPRKHTHRNHPSSKWALQSKANYLWLLDHTQRIFDERMWRFPDRAQHFTYDFFLWAKNNVYMLDFPEQELSPFAIAISEDSVCRQRIPNFNDLHPVEQYRNYYKYDKPFVTWTRRQIPKWMEI